ncbi:hypothetical protein CH63R_07428 [Colletotrichum higginsianum IMI 349063]|uniref:Uncharacterized protein n=1 Tax=Colletotrichum higginsianum (strain IMI 349063) TaxID=759273 RepID=A0A1B7Y992_COLHI|nr:hypothetical protein CH63R_07428 [Colletotrichum higginsianum IMI 349063]OBR08663.1 hypothetical protein CH63R_07428 [Colletotrichum higginsianum IMI 349063]
MPRSSPTPTSATPLQHPPSRPLLSRSAVTVVLRRMSGASSPALETSELAVAADCIGHAPLKLTGLRLYHSTKKLANLDRSYSEAGHNRTMSPESVSSLFPQRPIRPLPKRRLRERLSPEVADSIEYPPANQNSSPLFYYPNIARDERPARTGGPNYTSRGDVGYDDSPRGIGGAGESDEEELSLSSSKVVRRSHPEILNRMPTMPPKPEHSKHPNPQPPPSTASSVDGYESFENTNNKKKRKIPTAGDSALSAVHSLGDISSLGVSATASPSNDHGDLVGSVSPSYYGAGSVVANSQGISGPGRGRFGRSRNGRSPLRALSDATNNWVGRGAKIRPPQWATPGENHGIISSAIANAEKLPSTPGQENVSLLHQHSSSVKSSPTATQFTFTCDSPVPKPQWPGTDPAGSQSGYGPVGKAKHSSMATQTPSDLASTHAGQPTAPTSKPNAQPGASKKKSRCRAEKELRMAAKQRRQEAEYKYYNNPPKPEDMWICEFCEYERIFGEPPFALIRQYEIKDQKARRKEEERKRLLEKAKAKSRKGKKPAKSPGKAPSPQNLSQDQGGNVPMTSAVSNSTHDDDYVDDYPHDDEDFEGSYSQEDPPMLLSDDPDGDQEHDCTCPTCGDCGGREKQVDDPGDTIQ